MSNLNLWDSVSTTDPAHTKQFQGRDFKGTAIMPMYLIKKATEKWGPMGHKWGIRIIKTECINGKQLINSAGHNLGNEIIHVVQAELYYPTGEGKCDQGLVPCFGQTMLVSLTRNGVVTDEEAPKKSLTDALTKGLSWLGFGADVHMGRYDDSKYLNQLKSEFADDKVSKEQADILNDILMVGELDTARFLAWATKAAKRPVNAVEQLPADKFLAAKKILEDEAAKKAGAV